MIYKPRTGMSIHGILPIMCQDKPEKKQKHSRLEVLWISLTYSNHGNGSNGKPLQTRHIFTHLYMLAGYVEIYPRPIRFVIQLMFLPSFIIIFGAW